MVKKLTNIKERAIYFSKSQGITIEVFLTSIDMTYGSFKGEAKKRSLNSDAVEKILIKYPTINPIWLLTGVGDMEIKNQNNNSNQKLINSKKTHNEITNQDILLTPLISKYSQKEFAANFNNDTYLSKLNKIPWVNNLGLDSKCFKTFEIKGDKMDDNSPLSFLDGDLVLVMEIDKTLWSSLHKSKSSYAILHKNMSVIICQVANFNVNENLLFCHYLNELYQDFKIEITDILAAYKIVELRREPRF